MITLARHQYTYNHGYIEVNSLKFIIIVIMSGQTTIKLLFVMILLYPFTLILI